MFLNGKRASVLRAPALLNPVRLALFFEHNVLSQDRIVLLNIYPLGRVALVLDCVINIRTLCASEFHMHPLPGFFLGHNLFSPFIALALSERKTRPNRRVDYNIVYSAKNASKVSR